MTQDGAGSGIVPSAGASPAGTADSEAPGTEQKIFEAALEVFARKGHDGARMQEIADVAGINRALLHYYFRSKRHLYETCLGHCFKRFMRALGPRLSDTEGFADALRAFIDGYIDYIRNHREVALVMLNENLSGGTLLGEHLEAAFESGSAPQRIMEDRIRAAIQNGEIRAVDPKHTLLTIVSACLFFFVALPTVSHIHPQAREDFDAFVEARKRHVFDLLFHGLASESETREEER